MNTDRIDINKGFTHYAFHYGVSIIEFLVAMGIFVFMATTVGALVLQGFSSNRLADNETKAQLLAQEGIEAAISIRNQDVTLLVNGVHGITSVNNKWEFAGTSNAIGKYTRVVTIEDAQRNGTTLVDSGGVVDPTTKKVTSSVSWDFTQSRNNVVSYHMYLTDWTTAGGPTPTPTITPTTAPTPTPTTPAAPTSTPIPTPTPVIATCAQYCVSLNQSYTIGICRQTSQQCKKNNETYQSGGDQYCGGNTKSCCCR